MILNIESIVSYLLAFKMLVNKDGGMWNIIKNILCTSIDVLYKFKWLLTINCWFKIFDIDKSKFSEKKFYIGNQVKIIG